MKKTAILFIMLVCIAGLTACAKEEIYTSEIPDENKTTFELELDKDYSDTDPFVNEILFCVSEDLEDLNAMGTLEMDGERIILEVKNNKTNEVLWSNTWNGAVRSESFLISLGSLTKDNEYVICLTGTKINYAAAGITFDSNFVQEREKPLR